MPTLSSWRACYPLIRGLRDAVFDRAQTLDFDADHVAGLQELRRIHRHTYAVWRAREDQVARLQRARLPDERHELVTAEHQVGGVGVLAQIAVDPRAQVQASGLRHLVCGRHPGAERAERVGAFGASPLRLASLEIARADIVGDAVAGD